MDNVTMTNYMRTDGCDLLTGKSGKEPYSDCSECYRYDICKKALECEGKGNE